METLEKLLTVGFFAILLYFIIDYIMQQITGAINLDQLAPNIKYYMCRLGIFDAINIFVSFLIASWFTNKIITFLAG